MCVPVLGQFGRLHVEILVDNDLVSEGEIGEVLGRRHHIIQGDILGRAGCRDIPRMCSKENIKKNINLHSYNYS